MLLLLVQACSDHCPYRTSCHCNAVNYYCAQSLTIHSNWQSASDTHNLWLCLWRHVTGWWRERMRHSRPAAVAMATGRRRFNPSTTRGVADIADNELVMKWNRRLGADLGDAKIIALSFRGGNWLRLMISRGHWTTCRCINSTVNIFVAVDMLASVNFDSFPVNAILRYRNIFLYMAGLCYVYWCRL